MLFTKKFFLLSLLAFFSLLLSSSALAVTAIDYDSILPSFVTGCGETLDQDGETYVLASSLECVGGPTPTLTISGDDIVLGCGLQTIHSSNGLGIAVRVTGNNVHISDCLIDDFEVGVDFYYSSGSGVTNTVVTDGTFGINLVSTTGTTLTGNSLLGNEYGINVAGASTGNVFDSNTACGSGDDDFTCHPTSTSASGSGNFFDEVSVCADGWPDTLSYNPCSASDYFTLDSSDCGAQLTSSGTYTLTEDMHCPGQNGIVIAGDSVALLCDDHEISGDGSQNGIHVTADNVQIYDCAVSSFSTGINLYGALSPVLDSNIVSSSSYDGISLYDVEDGSFNGNLVQDSGNIGINLGGGSRSNAFDSNILTGNAMYGVYFYGSGENSFQSGLVAANADSGIRVGSVGNQILSNTVEDNGGSGVSLFNFVGATLIEDNDIFNNELFGIHLNVYPHLNEIYRNTIYQNEHGIYFEGGAGEGSIIEGNAVYENRDMGIFLDGVTDVIVYSNTVTDNVFNGIQVIGDSTVSIDGNTVTNNGNRGINLKGTSDAEVYENYACDNVGYDFFCLSGAQAHGFRNQFGRATEDISVCDDAWPSTSDESAFCFDGFTTIFDADQCEGAGGIWYREICYDPLDADADASGFVDTNDASTYIANLYLDPFIDWESVKLFVYLYLNQPTS